MDIAGKTALVTGGTDGIGLEVARQLRAKGARVIVAGRRADGDDAISADLSTAEGCAALVAAFGDTPIDILVNNAGMAGNFGPDEPLDLALTDRAIFLNLNAPIHLTGLLLEKLKARPQAAIVNVTSGLAIAPRAGGPVYCASKAALRSFTQAMRHNLKGSNVRMIEALPPVVDTAMTAARDGGKMSPHECARQIVAAIERDRAEANVGIVKLLQLVHSVSPALARRNHDPLLMDAVAEMEASLVAIADAGIDLRGPLFARFFAAYPHRRPIFYNPEVSSRRMTDETIGMMLGLAGGEGWVTPLANELMFTHRNYGALPMAEYDAFIEMTVDTMAEAAARVWTPASNAAWRAQAERLKSVIREARDGWARVMPGEMSLAASITALP